MMSRGRKPVHGHSRVGMRTPEYRSWEAMVRRCTVTDSDRWKWYGGRGITVCRKWQKSFEAFLKDVGLRPGPGFTLDRKQNDKGYTPTNTYWASRVQQANNKRNNRKITFKRLTLTVSEWARRIDVPAITLFMRLNRGWSIKDILEKPRRGHAG